MFPYSTMDCPITNFPLEPLALGNLPPYMFIVRRIFGNYAIKSRYVSLILVPSSVQQSSATLQQVLVVRGLLVPFVFWYWWNSNIQCINRSVLHRPWSMALSVCSTIIKNYKYHWYQKPNPDDIKISNLKISFQFPTSNFKYKNTVISMCCLHPSMYRLRSCTSMFSTLDFNNIINTPLRLTRGEGVENRGDGTNPTRPNFRTQNLSTRQQAEGKTCLPLP